MQKTQSLKYDWLHLAILATAALAIGIYLIATSVTIASDGVFYINQARDLALDPHGVAQRYPIGYPALLFVAHKVAGLFVEGDSPAGWAYSSQVVTLLCRVAALMFLYLLGRRLVGARRSFWAVLILVVLPYPARYGADVLREWPFLLFLSVGFWLLLKALGGKRWRLFGLVGLASGLGYLIRPMCGQLVIYGLLALLAAFLAREQRAKLALLGAGLFLLLGFAIPVVPYLAWTGMAVPHQFRPPLLDSAPVITTVGGKSARREPLQFDVRPDELFEVAIEAFDPDGDALAFSVVAIPPGTRPVYRLRSSVHRADFWTIAEDEKEELVTSSRRVWDYKGIDYYAYPRGVASGLEPVYRFWSPLLNRHFYTILRSERLALGQHASAHQWRNEGIVFYVWPEDRAPLDAVPIHRFCGHSGEHFWARNDEAEAIEPLAGHDVEVEGIAWCAHLAGKAPTGLTLEAGNLRWRPATGQQGEHQLNIIVSDGELESCQLLRIDVRRTDRPAGVGPERQSTEPLRSEPATNRPTDEDGPVSAEPMSSGRGNRLGMVLNAANAVLGGISANLMGFFLLPLCVGLGYRLRYEAAWQERVLMTGVVVVNVGLMLGRYMWVEPALARRYGVGLIALSIYYVPTGLEVMAQWLRTCADRIFGDRGRAELGDRIWFYVLLSLGVAICFPKLLAPIHANKRGCRQVATWLRDHTAADAVVAVPDGRISFYAERKGRVYRQQADPRNVDYVVILRVDAGASLRVEGWDARYSCWDDESRGLRLVVFQVR